jgi:hypothetical protein
MIAKKSQLHKNLPKAAKPTEASPDHDFKLVTFNFARTVHEKERLNIWQPLKKLPLKNIIKIKTLFLNANN